MLGPAPGERAPGASPVPEPAGPLDFGWRLSGDRGVAPQQVFSDSRQTWLQWAPGQAMPAILAAGADGEHVLTYQRRDPYTVIEGHWPELVFRSGSRQAVARKRGVSAARQAASVTPGADPATPSSAAAALPSGRNQRTDTPQFPMQPATVAQSLSSSASAPAAPASSPTSPTPAPAVAFAVTPDDAHLRQALARWTGLSGWRFQPEHWAVDIDVPISAGAAFGDDFVPAVQALVAATELSDRPLQPCFYSNQVLRVVAASEPCDRTVAAGDPT